MMFERFADNADWLMAMGVNVPDPEQFRVAAAKLRRNQLLVFSRWCQVMFRFEKALYDDPEQDLNRLWWDLVEKYQEIKRPEGATSPTTPASTHCHRAPAYYHNYMLGEMFASQVHHASAREACCRGAKPAAARSTWATRRPGQFMKERVFAPGLTLNWDELTRHATGEALNPKAFAEDLRKAK